MSTGEVHGEGGEDCEKPEALESGVCNTSTSLEWCREGNESVETDERTVPFAGISVDIWHKQTTWSQR